VLRASIDRARNETSSTYTPGDKYSGIYALLALITVTLGR
jgi:hypothetical protein